MLNFNSTSSQEKECEKKLSHKDKIVIPATHLPMFRTSMAVQRGVEKNILLKCWGGIGDIACSEPTLRYALKMFKDCEVSLASEEPSLFKHLNFKKVFDLNEVIPNYQKYLVFETITPPDESNLVWQFFSHMLVNCVDFPSMCALRCQLPIKDKELILSSERPKEDWIAKLEKGVFVHPGKHWQSKTFPREFWNEVLKELLRNNITPIIIGKNTDDNRSTVDVDPTDCIDLRNKTSLPETTWLMQRAQVLLTNDSAPLHLAASTAPQEPDTTGFAWIGFIATAKHYDFITHWRKGVWQFKEKNFSKSGVWDVISHSPNQDQEISAEFVDQKLLESWLPDPKEYARWAVQCSKIKLEAF